MTRIPRGMASRSEHKQAGRLDYDEEMSANVEWWKDHGFTQDDFATLEMLQNPSNFILAEGRENMQRFREKGLVENNRLTQNGRIILRALQDDLRNRYSAGLNRSRIESIISRSEAVKLDRLTDELTLVDFVMDIPVDKIIAGEETYAFQHVGTKYESTSTGRPIDTIYSPSRDNFMVINGHHRFVEARARGDKTIKGLVSIQNDEKHAGTYMEADFKAQGFDLSRLPEV